MVEQPLPFGAKPRLALLYLNSEAIKTGSPQIEIGNSYREFCRLIGLDEAGKTFYDLKKQMMALAAARLTFGFTHDDIATTMAFQPIDRFDAWLLKDGDQMTLWPACLELSPRYMASLMEHAVPLPFSSVTPLAHSAMALDILAWESKRLPTLSKPLRLPWAALKEQFGQEYQDVRHFRRKFLQAQSQVKLVYKGASVETVEGGLVLKPSRPLVQKITAQVPAQLETPRPVLVTGPELPERAINRFRKLYPGQDVYAAKGDFDAWVKGKEVPKDYTKAFFGFVKKWIAAKK